MKRFELYFLGDDVPELQMTKFSNTHEDSVSLCVRGKNPHSLFESRPFQWTSAVRALALLMIRTVAWRFDRNATQPLIQGKQKSPAASLDYAMSKQTGWLLDMFGITSEGEPIVKRLIHRVNPERKRPGPVTLSVNVFELPGDSISIYLNGESCTNLSPLRVLLNLLDPTPPSNDDRELPIHTERKRFGRRTLPLPLGMNDD